MCGWAIGYNCAINFTSHAGNQIIGVGAGLAGLLSAGPLFQRFIIKIALRTCLLLPDHFKSPSYTPADVLSRYMLSYRY